MDAFTEKKISAIKEEAQKKMSDQIKSRDQSISDLEAKISHLQQELESSKEKLADRRYQRGIIKARPEEIDAAIEDFTEVIRLKSNFIEAYSARGFCHILKSNYSAAIDDFTFCIQNEPESIFYAQRALAYEALNEGSKAASDRIEAEKLESKYFSPEFKNKMADHYVRHAEVEFHQGHYQIANVFYSEAIRLNPDEPSYYQKRAKSYSLLNAEERSQHDRDLADAKMQSLKPPLLQDEKTRQCSNPDILTLIANYETNSSLNSHLQINQSHHLTLKHLLKKRWLPRLETEWEKTRTNNLFRKFVVDGSSERYYLFLEDLPGRLQLPSNTHALIEMLKYAVKNEFFTLIHFLSQQEIDVNSYHIIEDYDENRCDYYYALDEILGRLNGSKEALEHAILTLPKLVNLGFKILTKAIPNICHILENIEKYPKNCVIAATKILIEFLKDGHLNDKKYNPALKAAMKIAKEIHDPSVIQLEAHFLLIQLQSYLASRTLFSKNPKDISIIQVAIEDFKAVISLKKINEHHESAFEFIKSKLHEASQHSDKEGGLFKTLEKIEQENLISFRPMAQLVLAESKAKTPTNSGQLVADNKMPPTSSYGRLFSSPHCFVNFKQPHATTEKNDILKTLSPS